MKITKSDKEFIEDWEKTRKMGLPKFMIIHGGIFAILMTVIVLLFELYDNSLKEIFLSAHFLERLIISLVFSIVGYGGIMWYLNNRRYKRLKEDE